MTFRLLDHAPHCAMFDLDDLDGVEGLFAHLRAVADAGEVPGIIDMVPAARTLLVVTRSARDRAAVVDAAHCWEPTRGTSIGGTEHVIDVVYDGPDMAEVCERTALSTDEVVRLHSQARYRVAFMGFAPGFGYLTGLPEPLWLSRKESPRTQVPPRSVAVAGEYSAVYPRASPGGWNLIGHSVQEMWQDDADRPTVLAPGDTVRFRPVEGP